MLSADDVYWHCDCGGRAAVLLELFIELETCALREGSRLIKVPKECGIQDTVKEKQSVHSSRDDRGRESVFSSKKCPQKTTKSHKNLFPQKVVIHNSSKFPHLSLVRSWIDVRS